MLELSFDTGPGMCAAGHVLHGGTVLVGWRPCACPGSRAGGHRTWTCWRCLDEGRGAEATLFACRHDPTAEEIQGGPEL